MCCGGKALSVFLKDLSAATYQPHLLHGQDRQWQQTNCYVDLWIELLASLKQEPRAMLGFTLAQDFEGDQFTFFKVPLEDLESLYGLKVQELAIFDRLEHHVITQLERGRLVLVEMDGYYLPDTRGVSYRTLHPKTTIAINQLDMAQRRMGYFHNAGYYELGGEDFDGIFGRLPHQLGRADALFPYAEFVKLPAPLPLPAPQDLAQQALILLRRHLARRPQSNPLLAYQQDFAAHMIALANRDEAYFHLYAFNTLRQMGANFELLGAHLAWLGEQGILQTQALHVACAACETLSSGGKTLQFQVARAVARRRFAELEKGLDPLVSAYDTLMQELDILLSH